MFKGGMAGMMQKAKQMQEDMEAVQKKLNHSAVRVMQAQVL